jgi:uncharacterized protein DUF3455
MTIFTTFVSLIRLTAMLAAGTFLLVAAADVSSAKDGVVEVPAALNPDKLSIVRVVSAQTFAQVPAAIAVSDETIVATFHAEGAQVYECKLDPANKLVWQFREPIAALMLDGKTVGLHSVGPNWQHFDGSAVRAKMVSSAPGATSNDVPWLKLETTEQRGNGTLSHVATVQRINTKGGATQGPCETAGAYRSVPYSADYVFLRR